MMPHKPMLQIINIKKQRRQCRRRW